MADAEDLQEVLSRIDAAVSDEETGVAIDDTRMTSTASGHMALRLGDDPDVWAVTWLPARTLTRAQAVTAMMLAHRVAPRIDADELRHDHPLWPLIDRYAAQLDLTGPDAVVRVSEPAGEQLPALVDEALRRGATTPATVAAAAGVELAELREQWSSWAAARRAEHIASGGTNGLPLDEFGAVLRLFRDEEEAE